ncbi:AAA family ATPase [Spirosoma oryzicola]|uniref:AAA family ATPase n=1 Tax=Spirosoma oryzicola TaxID=2898794 RepID=UPI001E4CB21B|nr:AAA family ATPase [Spirosoma oryzicola]UHG89456.1 AAA family ATPase [Spirosoma oryzicola]
MITPEEFPYITSLYVNDCYAYKDFNIELHDYKPFSHLILTGKNGSGKSTILKTIDKHFAIWRGISQQNYLITINDPVKHLDRLKSSIKDQRKTKGEYSSEVTRTQTEIDFLSRINLNYKKGVDNFWVQNKVNTLYAFFQAKRVGEVTQVSTVTKETEFFNQLLGDDTSEKFVKKFKQYLVNKKVYQAFDQLDNNKTQLSESEEFFKRLTETFRSIFEDEDLNLVFIRESFEFFIQLSDGRRLTFDTLSEGFSALLSILMDLFMRVDLIRKQVGDYSYNPCGIVLIDEPETHLHLQLQEQVLPLLTSLFPNIQFIAATHSPAVIASIKQATIFDLTTKETRISEEAVGRSYSDLMMSHFGLNNEYSETADQIINQVNEVLNTLADKPIEMKTALQRIYDHQSAYLSPTLKVELELLIAQQEAQHNAHQ